MPFLETLKSNVLFVESNKDVRYDNIKTNFAVQQIIRIFPTMHCSFNIKKILSWFSNVQMFNLDLCLKAKKSIQKNILYLFIGTGTVLINKHFSKCASVSNKSHFRPWDKIDNKSD